MTKGARVSLVSLALLVAWVSFELARGFIDYRTATTRMQTAFQQIEPGMTKEQVKQITGEPDSATKRADAELWYWDAGRHQSILSRVFGLAPAKGHETLVIEFDEEGRVTRTWGGLN